MTKAEQVAAYKAGKEQQGEGSSLPPKPRLPSVLTCIHRGESTGETRGCKSCRGEVQLKLLACAVHGVCLPTKEVEGVACCKTCKERVPAVSFKDRNIIMAAEADVFAESIPAYPEGKFSGRGVVISGGGKYWPSAYVTVRMLRHVGCDLPIQVWYLGAAERDDSYDALLAPFGVEVVDTLAHPQAALTRNLTGFAGHPPFQAKSFAVLHSPFEEVLMLDADNYPCRNPTDLFNSSGYRKTGGIFWPDGAFTNKLTRWEQWGVKKFGPDCGWETGQYVIHKRLAWRQINMARWYDDHGDWCYGGMSHHDHGDKGSHRVGWARFRTAPEFFSTRCIWKAVAFLQLGSDGETIFVHRCRGKFLLKRSVFASTPQNSFNRRYGLPGEKEAFGFLEELRQLKSPKRLLRR